MPSSSLSSTLPLPSSLKLPLICSKNARGQCKKCEG